MNIHEMAATHASPIFRQFLKMACTRSHLFYQIFILNVILRNMRGKVAHYRSVHYSSKMKRRLRIALYCGTII